MLDLFAQLFQHCWGHARSLCMDYKDLWVVFFPQCTAGPKLVGSCCIRLHTTANTHATTPNIVGATMLGVVASVCTPLPTCTQQLPTSLDQQCWELLCPFACSLRNCSEVWQRRWPWGNQTQLLNVCHLVPFLLSTSLRIHSFLLADHGEGQLCSSIFHLIVTDCCL